jgi:hypothetical protein
MKEKDEAKEKLVRKRRHTKINKRQNNNFWPVGGLLIKNVNLIRGLLSLSV